MTVFAASGVLFAGSIAAGLIGALTGMGGGVVLVPLITLGLGVDIHYAAGASLVSVIATSSGAAAAYVKEHYANIRIGLFLEMATVCGALAGAAAAVRAEARIVEILFGTVLIISAAASFRRHPAAPIGQNTGDRLSRWFKLNGAYPENGRLVPYAAQRIVPGFLWMFVAGGVSGLLGIGSGALKVLAMDQTMRLPFKVSTTTSNFMIGVTAAASAGVYLSKGFIDPGIAMPVVLGVLAGSVAGARLLKHSPVPLLRILFSVVIFILAVQMIAHGLRSPR